MAKSLMFSIPRRSQCPGSPRAMRKSASGFARLDEAILIPMRRWIVALLFATVLSAADAKYDGARVHYESYGKGRETVVFIHGWTCDLTFWRGQAPVYTKRRALLIDLPGHGQ